MNQPNTQFSYNHQKLPNGKSILEIQLWHNGRSEGHYRKWCKEFTPATHHMVDWHPLRECLPRAWNLETDALRELNQKLPGVIYEMPKVVEYLVNLSCEAVREMNPHKAKLARAKLLQIVMPVDADRDTTPITAHSAVVIQYVAEDFYLVSEVFMKEVDEGLPPSRVVPEIEKLFRDIEPKWIRAICKPNARISELVYKRTGEITGSKGRGEYEAWRKENPGYLAKIKSEAKKIAFTINLPYA